MEQYVWPLL
jgi:hypothetical protein